MGGRPSPNLNSGFTSASARLPIFAIAAVLLLIFIAFAVSSCFSASHEAPLEHEALADTQGPIASVSFVAVGDNLADETLCAYADASAGEVGDGAYDFTPIYAAIKPLVQEADLAYVSQETHLGGDEIGVRGWPSYNTPDSMADALVDTGFDLVALASNHCYDFGNFGALEHSRGVWNKQPVAVAGVATSQEEADNIPIVEREGITFAFLDYTYGLNGFEPEELAPYAVNFISEERLRADVPRARELADIVVVAMHWGTEYLTEADENQQHYAQLLADLGADIVLGSHPHVIGPVEWVEGESGHKTLVAYALGDLKSNHSEPVLETEMTGMLACDFVRQAEGNAVSVENARWIPLVNHIEDGAHAVYPLHDYTDELASRHTFLSTLENPIGQLREASERIVNSRGANLPLE